MVLACHVMSQDHVIRGSCDFIGSSALKRAAILPNLGVIATLVAGL